MMLLALAAAAATAAPSPATTATIARAPSSQLEVQAHNAAFQSVIARAIKEAMAQQPPPLHAQQPPFNLARPSKPTLPSKWSADTVTHTSFNGTAAAFITPDTVVAVDVPQKRQYTHGGFKLPFAPLAFVGTPLEWLNSTNFVTENGTFMILAGAKYHNPAAPAFSDPFRWLHSPLARYDGDEVENGTKLHRWVMKLAREKVSLLLKVDQEGTPVVFVVNATIHYPVYLSHYSSTTRYLTFHPAGEIPGVWDGFDEALYLHPPPCPADPIPPPVNMTIFIFHPRHAFNVSAQDNGDEQGDVTFVCEDLITNSSKAMGEDYQWISQWTVDHVPRYGQYQNCNGYPSLCFGNEHFWVGHEAALGLGAPMAGQCSTNPLVGEWFSLPAGGKCADGALPGDGSCTWRAWRVKTIDSKCLFAHGYIDACRADGRAPFAQAKRHFSAAFASEDESAGGCPALQVG